MPDPINPESMLRSTLVAQIKVALKEYARLVVLWSPQREAAAAEAARINDLEQAIPDDAGLIRPVDLARELAKTGLWQGNPARVWEHAQAEAANMLSVLAQSQRARIAQARPCTCGAGPGISPNGAHEPFCGQVEIDPDGPDVAPVVRATEITHLRETDSLLNAALRRYEQACPECRGSNGQHSGDCSQYFKETGP